MIANKLIFYADFKPIFISFFIILIKGVITAIKINIKPIIKETIKTDTFKYNKVNISLCNKKSFRYLKIKWAQGIEITKLII